MHRAAAVLALLLLALVSSAEARTLVTLHSFCSLANCADGDQPVGGLVRDGDGNLYGTANSGGAHGNGVVYMLEKQGEKYRFKVLHDFCIACGEGGGSVTSLIIDTQGNLYGMTIYDGMFACNNLFKLSRKTFEILYSMCTGDFRGSSDFNLSYQGQNTGAPYDGHSPLYGVMNLIGSLARGSLFSLTKKSGTWTAREIYAFCAKKNCRDGSLPRGPVTVDAQGDLYGTTYVGGSGFDGTLYKFSPGAHALTVLWNFCLDKNNCDGVSPVGAVALTADGSVYGMTEHEKFIDPHTATVFSYHAGSLDVVHNFCVEQGCPDGDAPFEGVTSPDGAIVYGTMTAGGVNRDDGGTIFQVDGGTLTTLYSFCALGRCRDGQAPVSLPVPDPDGNLFGTTDLGGKHKKGTVYELKVL